jgi:serine/threonine protein kinase
LKSRIKSLEGKNILNYGLFGVSGRDNHKIYQKQVQVLGNGMSDLKKVLKKGFDYGGNVLVENSEFMDLLGRLLDFNPNRRIGPSAVLKHRFLL